MHADNFPGLPARYCIISANPVSIALIELEKLTANEVLTRVPTASGNQGKLKGIFPVRKFGILLKIHGKIREF